MSSPPAEVEEEEATDVETEEEDAEEARVSAAAAADEDDSGETRTTCCVCMEPSTCSGAHRLCCIPCGHVYGRSCLENWLSACGNTSAKCPQCGEAFQRKHIINLYIPGNLWDGCCRIQEVEAHYSRVAKYLAVLAPLARRHASEAKSEAQFVSEVADKLEVLAQSVGAEDQDVDKKLVQDVLAMVMTSYASVKGQVEMAHRHYEDLLEFVVQSFDGLLEPDYLK